MGTVTPFQLASGKTLRGWGVFGWWLAAILFGAAIAKGQSIQAVPLSRGWNLVSLQVGDPAGIPVIQIADHLDRKASLLSLWTYDPIAHDFKSYHRRNSEYPSDLTTVQPGQGFWIEVDSDTTLRMEGSEWRGNFVLVPGWNLVGFPGLETEVSGGIPLDSVLGALAEQIPQVWTFESGSSVSGGQRYVGWDLTARPSLRELQFIQPGRGYWVFAHQRVEIPNRPVLLLPADTDAADASNALGQPEAFDAAQFPRVSADRVSIYATRQVVRAGTEDTPFDVNGNGIVDDPYTQDTVRFDEGVSVQRLSVLNTNGLLAAWSIPVVRASPWLRFSVTNGTTATELDSVEVMVDRSHLVAGQYRGQFEVRLGTENRTVRVDLRVPTIAGDYRGAAKTTRVNGSSVSLGKVDLHLSMFMEGDNPATNRFRGVINRDIALLFPQDVFLDGVFYQGNDFSLTTTFEMPAGPEVKPPYDTAIEVLNSNPFPFPIHRQVTLQGTRVDADRLSGLYIESISGVLPNNQRITIEGEFDLRRESLSPTRRSIYNGRSPVTPVAIGGTTTGQSIMTSMLRVEDDVSIQGVEVTVNATYPNPSILTVSLIAPPQGLEPGFRRVLWNAANPLRTGSVLALQDFNGLSGRGDWTLEVEWGSSPIRGEFNGWQLNLLGLATYSAVGSVKTVQGTDHVVLPGATVTLAGGNILYQSLSGTNGDFAFSGLTENLYTLGASRLGYQDGSLQFRITRSNMDLPSIVLNPITTGTNVILATPQIGAAPLRVEFAPRIPLAQLTALGTNVVATWDFGDGTPLLRLTNSPAVIEHHYVAGVHTWARLVLSGSLGSITNVSPDIHAHSLAANPAIAPHQLGMTNLTPSSWFVHSLAPWGSLGASPVMNTVLTVVSNAPTTGILYQESQRDTAAFDINRIGAGLPAFRPSAEDTAFFLQPGTPYVRGTLRDPVDRALGEPATSYKTYTGNQRFRMVCTLGGSVFGTSPAAAGNLRIQTSRIEP